MVKHILHSILFLLSSTCAVAQILPNFGGERAGLSTLSFLKNDMSVRSSAMGGSSVSLNGDGYSVITNPAALTDLEETSLTMSHYFVGAGVHQSFASSVFGLKDDISKIGFSINSLNSGLMEERTEFQPEGTGRQVSVSNLAIGGTYARQLSALFSAGLTVKYVYEGIAGYTNHSATVDMAFLYRVDYKDLKFAVMVRNFGGNSSLGADEDIPVLFNRNQGISLESNTIPTIFSLGISMVPYKTENNSLLASIQLNHPNDNSENYRIGLEYEFEELFFARAGYKISVKDQDWPTFGFGLRTRLGGYPLYIDYAANPTNNFGFQNLIGLRLQLKSNVRE